MSTRKSVEDIQDAIDGDGVWRKRELRALLGLLNAARPHERSVLARSCVTMTYAHWEGFVKSTLEVVQDYIGQQSLTLADVNSCLAASTLKGMMGEAAQMRSTRGALQIVQAMSTADQIACKVPAKVNTRSNLSDEVFLDLLLTIGIDGATVKSSQPGVTDVDIDERLLAKRNRIAHGEYVLADEAEAEELIDSVVALFDALRTAVMNYLALGEFRAVPKAVGVP